MSCRAWATGGTTGAIPESVFEKPPSAELRPDQKDSDSLPPYEVLDAILRLYVEEFRGVEEIAEDLSLPVELVKDVALKVDRNEYKRQQAAPGLKVTSKAFGIGRRFPSLSVISRTNENQIARSVDGGNGRHTLVANASSRAGRVSGRWQLSAQQRMAHSPDRHDGSGGYFSDGDGRNSG